MQKQKVETLEYSTEYQPKEIISNLINQKKNYHVIKDRTGSGATYGICDLDTERIILLSPTIQLVKDKEKQYLAGHFSKTNISFYYGDAIAKIGDCKPVIDGGHLVMGTADQLVYLKIEDFVNAGYTLIIDELHLDVMGSIYRDKLNQPFTKLTQAFKTVGSVITITATPLHIYPEIFDDFNTLKLIKYQGVKKVVLLTSEKKEFKQFIDDIDVDNKKLLFFSNDDAMLTKIAKRFEHKKIATILGNTLKVKNIVKFGELNAEDADVIIASSAAMEGVDVNLEDGIIVIHNRYNTEFGLFTTQTMLQALGRIRAGYGNALIYLDNASDLIEKVPSTVIKSNMVVTAERNKMISLDLITGHKLKDEFEKYNYIIADDNLFNKLRAVGDLDGCSATIPEMVRNIYKISDTDFKFNLVQVLNNSHVNNRFYGFSAKICFGFLISAILKNTDCDVEAVLRYINAADIRDSIVKFRSLLEVSGLLVNKFSETNKDMIPEMPLISYKSLAHFRVSSGINFGEIDINELLANTSDIPTKQLLEKFEMLAYTQYTTRATKSKVEKYVENNYVVMQDDKLATVNKFLLTKYFKALNKSKDKKVIYATKERAKMVVTLLEKIKEQDIDYNNFKETVKDNFQGNDFFNLDCTDSIIHFVVKEGTTNLLDEVKKLGLLFVREFKSGLIEKDNREYSSVTSIPIDIMGVIAPNGILEFDITEAYPTFVNGLIGYTSTGSTIYNNIMKELNVVRYVAKKMYNTMLNSTNLNIPEKYRIDFFEKACGYTSEQTKKIINFNVNKGDAFRLFASIEKEVVKDIQMQISWEYRDYVTVRRHDSLVIFGAKSTQKEMLVKTVYTHNNVDVNLTTTVHITQKLK